MLPALDYAVEREGVTLAVVNTNALTDEAGRMVAEAFGRTKGWRILFGHHVLRTWHDKENEDVLRPWLRRHGIVPHVVANGHAHLLQLGVYDDIVAITSGASARTRRRPECPPDCGPGQIYGSSHKGYGLLSVHTDRIEVVFADLRGRTLHEWSRKGPW